MDYGMMIGVNTPSTGRLPSGYTELEWIESTGTQYIDTGFIPTNNTGLDITFENISYPQDDNVILGSRSEFISDAIVFGLKSSGWIYFQHGVTDFFANPHGGWGELGKIYNVVFDSSNNSVYCNGLLINTFPSVNFAGKNSMVLFGYHDNYGVFTNANTRVYRFKIYDNGNLVRDYVPCINPSSAVGMYDTVNNIFYGNAGTGSFIAGYATGVSVTREVEQIFVEVGDSLVHPECIMSTANSLIFSASGRNFKKAYAGDAFVCIFVTHDGWLLPMLISTNENAVKYYTDGDYYSEIFGTTVTVTFQGQTWYVSTGGAGLPNTSVTITQANAIFLNNVADLGVTWYDTAFAFLNYVYSVSNVARKVTEGWVEVDLVARKFFGGALNLYNYGDECTNVTGGWYKGGYTRGDATATKNADNITLKINRAGDQTASIITTNKIDVTNYSKLVVMVKYASTDYSNGNFQVKLRSVNTNNMYDHVAIAHDPKYDYDGEIVVDTSSLTGSYYVEITIDGWTTSKTTTAVIHKVWLE